MLTKDSVELMYQRIEPAELPLSFANAVTVTRALGIRYLWIDALCIVQGDMGDFAANAPNMPDYFANGAINIVAGVQNSHSGFLHNRAKPQFLPLCINQAEDIYVGWLGTESYCDPRGINMNRFPDAWKYQSPPHTRAWIMQEIRLARRNLVFQADGNSSTGPLYLHTHDQALSAQLYMQCQKQIRWECGRTRSTSETASTDWYGLVEEYSGQQLTIERDRLIGFSSLAMRHSRESKTACGQYLAGLWSEDLFRGLLWRANDVRSRSTFHIAPSWSWASGSGLVKHVWPRNASVVAEVVHATTDDHYPDLAYIVVRGQLVEIKLMFELAAGWTGDITLQARTRDESYTSVRVRYFLDDARAFEQGRIYFLKITHRVALLLARTDSDRSEMERYGLVIVAKPDTQKWATAGVVKEVKII